MIKKLKKVRSTIETAKGKVSSKKEDVLDSLYGASNQLNLSTFNALPDSAREAITSLPQFNSELGNSRLQRWYENISKDKKIKVGGDIYQRFLALRRRIIGAKEGVHRSHAGPISYWQTQKRDKPTVIYFHGFADNKNNAFDLMQHLVKDYHVVVPDLPGFGSSFKDSHHHYGIESMAPWLKSFADSLGIETFHLIGHSMGGALAIDFAKRYPEMLNSLCLLCSAGVLGPSRSIYDDILDGDILFQIETLQEFDDFLRTAFFKLPFVPPFVKEYYFQEFLDNYDWYGEIVRHTFEDISSRDDERFQKKFFNKDLNRLTMPCHIIWGEKDAIFPAEIAGIIHKSIPHSTLNILQECGHSPHYEYPKETAQIIKGFVDQSQNDRSVKAKPEVKAAKKAVKTPSKAKSHAVKKKAAKAPSKAKAHASKKIDSKVKSNAKSKNTAAKTNKAKPTTKAGTTKKTAAAQKAKPA